MKNKLICRLFPALVAVPVILAGCSSGTAPSQNSSAAGAAYNTTARAEAPAMSAGEKEIADEVDMGVAEDFQPLEKNTTPISEVYRTDRMVVRTFNLTLETMDFDTGIEEIESIIVEYDGFMQDSYVQGRSMFDKNGTRRANFTVRIPSERLDEFVGRIDGQFNVINKQQSGQDITDQYYDTESRLKALRIQEERLLAMLETAGELEYLLQVERELATVRYELEGLTSSLLRMQSQVSMSTVYLYLDEVIEFTPVEPIPATFGEEAARAFGDSLKQFGEFIRGTVIVIIWILPFLIFPIIVAIVLIFVVVRGKKKKPSPSIAYAVKGNENEEE